MSKIMGVYAVMFVGAAVLSGFICAEFVSPARAAEGEGSAPILIQAQQFQLIDQNGHVRATICTYDADKTPASNNSMVYMALTDTDGRQKVCVGVDVNGQGFIDLNGRRMH